MLESIKICGRNEKSRIGLAMAEQSALLLGKGFLFGYPLDLVKRAGEGAACEATKAANPQHGGAEGKRSPGRGRRWRAGRAQGASGGLSARSTTCLGETLSLSGGDDRRGKKANAPMPARCVVALAPAGPCFAWPHSKVCTFRSYLKRERSPPCRVAECRRREAFGLAATGTLGDGR
jgi:hypothetical protein